MKKCIKCGRTSPPALVVCPRCKAPLSDSISAKSGSVSSGTGISHGDSGSKRAVLMAFILISALLVLSAVLFINKDLISAFFSGSHGDSDMPKGLVSLSNFHELHGVWSGMEINGSGGWTFSFSGIDSAYVSGPGVSYKGRAGIRWDIGTDGKVMRVPPGASNLDIDIKESSADQYKGKTSVGAFSIYSGRTMKLCSGEPGSTRRPLTFEPIPGIRCFELAKTTESPPDPLTAEQHQPAKTETSAAQPPSGVSSGDVIAAKEAFKQCMAAYKAGNMDEVRKYVLSKDLAEMEESGMLNMAMGMMAGLNIDEFTAAQQGDRIVFTKSEKQGDMTSSMSVNMVREAGQWKFGK